MVDGDKSLVVADVTMIAVAERNRKKFDVVPLYYEMKKAPPHILNNDVLYQGLITAFTTGNIGIYSNNISKIWNNDIFINGSFEEQMELINTIKLLCMENNFTIDTAKTLYKPVRPKKINDKIKQFTIQKLPAFFEFAKDKDKNQVTDRNNSFVNKLYNVVPNVKIDFRKLHLDKLDYKMLMHNPDIKFDVAFNDTGSLDEEHTDDLIVRYCEICKTQNFQLNSIMRDKIDSNEVRSKSQIRQDLKYKIASENIKKELSQFGYNDVEITDILVKYLYGIKDNKRKTILWLCYGDIIYNNLSKKLKNNLREVQCIDCGKWFTVHKFAGKVCRCNECQREYRKMFKREFIKNKRMNA